MIDFLGGLFRATLVIAVGLWIMFVRTPREEHNVRRLRLRRARWGVVALGVLLILLILDATVASTTFLARLTFPSALGIVLLAPFWIAGAMVFLTSTGSRM